MRGANIFLFFSRPHSRLAAIDAIDLMEKRSGYGIAEVFHNKKGETPSSMYWVLCVAAHMPKSRKQNRGRRFLKSQVWVESPPHTVRSGQDRHCAQSAVRSRRKA